MKQILTLILMLSGIFCFSQSSMSQISTDPTNPINLERPNMTNSFDWTAEWFDLNCDNITDNQIQSPFYQPNNININHLKESKDRLPQNGWELLHYDLGLSLSSGSVDYPYLVLYNRYTGTMRLFVAIASVNDHSAAQFKVYFLSDTQTHLLSSGESLIPLDNLVKDESSLISPSPFLNSNKMWFYADFTMMYDPCTCYANSKLVIKVDLIDYAEIKIKGESTGTLISIEDNDGNVKDDASAAFDPEDVKSVWKKGQKTYKDISKFVKDQEKAFKIEGKTDFELEMDGLYDKLKKRHSLNDFQKAIKADKFLRAGLKAAPYIGAATALVDLFVGGGQEASGPQEVKLTPTSINLNSSYKGTITTDYPYKTIIFNTPGTNNSSILDDDEYPLYNHTLGVFNLLETPQLHYTEEHRWNHKVGEFYSLKIKPISDLKFVINPAAGFKPNPEVFFAYYFVFNEKKVEGYEEKVINNGLIIKEDDLTYRTKYLPSGAYKDLIPNYYLHDWNIFPHPYGDNLGHKIEAVWLKLMVNLEREDATEKTQNVLWVGKYPVNLISVDDNQIHIGRAH